MTVSPGNTRNSKGSGSIRPYGDGKFRVRVTLGGVTKTKIVPSYRAGERQVYDWTLEHEQGTLIVGSKLTLVQTIEQWLTHAEHLAMTTRQSYQQKLDAYIKWSPLGATKISSIRATDIEAFLKSLNNGKFAAAKTKELDKQIKAIKKLDPQGRAKRVKLIAYKPRTPEFKYSRSVQRQCFALIREAMKWAARSDVGLITRNIANDIVPPAALTNARRDASKPGTKGEKHGYILPHEHLMAILEAAHKDRLRLRWLLALDLGLRVGEVLGLCWGDLDEQTGILTVRRQVQHSTERGTTVIVHGVKTPSGLREIPMPEYLIKEWHAHKTSQWRDKFDGWEPYEFDGHRYDLCFTKEHGGVIPQRLDGTNWERLLQRTKLENPATGKIEPVPHVRRYVARHSAASRMVAAPDSDIMSIASILGHSSADFTLRKYSHALDEKKRATIAALDTANSNRLQRWKDQQDSAAQGGMSRDELEATLNADERAARAVWEQEEYEQQETARTAREEARRARRQA